jgi:hypothetical protein
MTIINFIFYFSYFKYFFFVSATRFVLEIDNGTGIPKLEFKIAATFPVQLETWFC